MQLKIGDIIIARKNRARIYEDTPFRIKDIYVSERNRKVQVCMTCDETGEIVEVLYSYINNNFKIK